MNSPKMAPDLKLTFASSYNISTYSRFNLSENESDIHVFIGEYRDRVMKQLAREEAGAKTLFVSFADTISVENLDWLDDNSERFFRDTQNDSKVKSNCLSECGYIFCMLYAPDGSYVLVGHSSGLIQEHILSEYAKDIEDYYNHESKPKIWYPMFYRGRLKEKNRKAWVKENHERFLKGTPNKVVYDRWFYNEIGAITALQFSPNGFHIIVGHSSGLIQMRHGNTGTVLCTLRNLQFPPKPVYALEYSRVEERVCYAACMDGLVYRIEIPSIDSPVSDQPAYCIRADPILDSLNMQFYGSPGTASYATPFVAQRSPALSLGILAEGTKLIVGYADTSIKVYDMETQEADITYKVHKLRLQFIPKKLRRMHSGQVCALRCHDEKPYMFASAGWDQTLRIWDIRCKVGCVMTFEGVNICSDSIDLNRDHCIAGSWQPTEALMEWDLVARKRLNVIRVQNRRPDVDGEYIYACRYWNSSDYNRKGKYAVVGGSGTNCVEVVNLHNRYIACSYPTAGTVLATTSYQERIAFGGTSTAFSIVNFYDPKHEKDKYHTEVDYDYTKAPTTFYEDEDGSIQSEYEYLSELDHNAHSVTTSVSHKSKMSKLM